MRPPQAPQLEQLEQLEDAAGAERGRPPGGFGGAQPAPDLERETLRLCDRYVEEVVIAFGLCPWAEPALRGDRVARRVFLEAEPDPAAVAAAIAGLDSTAAGDRPAAVEIGLYLFPRHVGGWSAFDGFAERVRRADRARRGPGERPAFLVATFHPEAAETLAHPRQLTPFLRRSPHPMLQIVRTRSLDRVKAHDPTASEDLAAATFAALSADCAAKARALAEVVRAIHLDRDRDQSERYERSR